MIQFKNFQSDCAEGLVRQMNNWMKNQNENIQYIDFKIAAASEIFGSGYQCITQHAKVFGILIYQKEKFRPYDPILERKV